MKMQSVYKGNNPKRPPKTSKDSNENDKLVSKKVKTENNLRGGSPNVVNPSRGTILIEQAFYSPENG